MFCKYCKAEIKKGNKFCPYCGKKIVEGDSTTESKEESTYNDPFKDYRIDNNSHQDQYNYQNQYSGSIPYKDTNNTNQIKYKDPDPYTQNNNSTLALIFAILGVISLFYIPLLSILFGILALIFGIIGRKHTSKAFGTFVMVISILSFISNMILGPTVFVFSLDITIAGETTTLFEYLKSSFESMFNESYLSGEFYTKEGHMFILDSYYGNYYYYNDPRDTTNLYFTGNYIINDGATVKNETIYADKNYYYYTLILSNQYFVDENGEKSLDKLIFTRPMIIKLNKKDKTKLIIYDNVTNLELSKNIKIESNELPTT